KWEKLTKNSIGGKRQVEIYAENTTKKVKKYNPFYIYVAKEKIDPFLVYRLIHPGYYNWSTMKIEQRSLESFEKTSIVENQLLEKNCVNCHTFNQNNPEKFLIHIRGSKG